MFLNKETSTRKKVNDSIKYEVRTGIEQNVSQEKGTQAKIKIKT